MTCSTFARASRLSILITGAATAITLIAGTARAAQEKFPADWFWGESDQRAKQDELVGKPMPKLEVDGWLNGKKVTTDDMKGKIVVIDFWATWCGPCLAALPENNEIAKDHAAEGVLVVGVCGSGSGQERMEEVAKERKIEYAVAKDSTQKAAELWRVMWWPTYGIIDRKGNLRALGVKSSHVKDVVEALLKEQPAEKKKDAAPREGDARLATEKVAAAAVTIKAEWKEGAGERRKTIDAMEGKAPPAIKLKDWTNGKSVTLADLKGKVVLLDFWATWCGPCIASIPHTNELQEKYKDKGLFVIGVCATDGAEKMADTVKEKGIRYLVAADVNGATVKAYQNDGFPDYYLIDRSGNLRIADCKNASVDEAVEALLAEPDPKAAAARAE